MNFVLQCIRCFLILLILFISINVHSQAENFTSAKTDSNYNKNYYSNLNNQFILRFYGLYKTNNVNISKEDMTLEYKPNGVFSIGVGFNYKFLGLGFSFGAPSSAKSNEKYGTTQRLDFQVSIISKAIGLDGFLQIYKGYYIANPNDFIEWKDENYPQLSDMKVLTLGLNAFYLFNSDKYSYRAAFIGNQVQNKSSGSITAGLFGTFDQVKTDNGFVPASLSDSVQTEFDLKSFQAYTIGLSVGYMYTFVFGKGFFLSLAAVPGMGYRHYDLERLDDSKETKDQLAVQLLGRIALGYTMNRLYINFNTIFNVRNYNYKSYNLSLSTEQLRLTLGIRFQTKASKKRNQIHP